MVVIGYRHLPFVSRTIIEVTLAVALPRGDSERFTTRFNSRQKLPRFAPFSPEVTHFGGYFENKFWKKHLILVKCPHCSFRIRPGHLGCKLTYCSESKMKPFSVVSSWRNRVRPVAVDPSPVAVPGRRQPARNATPEQPRGYPLVSATHWSTLANTIHKLDMWSLISWSKIQIVWQWKSETRSSHQITIKNIKLPWHFWLKCWLFQKYTVNFRDLDIIL